MAATNVFFTTLMMSIISLSVSIKSGTVIDQCQYPGLISIIGDNGAIICTGIRTAGALVVPELCGNGLSSILANKDLTIMYGDGITNTTLPQGTSVGSSVDGVYTIPFSDTFNDSCSAAAEIYDPATMAIDSSTCEVVGYGGSTNPTSGPYNGVAQATSITQSTSAPCCDLLISGLSAYQKKRVLDLTVSLNCLTASGSACGLGDIGAPVYCGLASDPTTKVVIGLTASAPCVDSDTFLIHDLTSSDATIKWGI